MKNESRIMNHELRSKRVRIGDLVKIISGSKKGTVAKVIQVLPKKDAAILEGIGVRSRHVRKSQYNPKGGKKDIVVPVSLSKLAVVIDEKTSKTSRVGYVKTTEGKTVRVARAANNREIK